jgi:AraC-like DNA-binding protein
VVGAGRSNCPIQAKTGREWPSAHHCTPAGVGIYFRNYSGPLPFGLHYIVPHREAALHTLRTAQPSPALRPFVRAYAQRQTAADDATVIEVCPAQLEQILYFELANKFDIWHSNGKHQTSDDVNVIGCHSAFAAHAELKAGLDSFAIFFQPTGFWRLFRVPGSETTNRGGIEGNSVLGSSIRILWNRLGETRSFEDRVGVAENFLLCLSTRALQLNPITYVAEHVFQQHGAIHIPDLARAAGLGLRQFERRFVRELGISPKVYARVARFQSAVDKKIAQPDTPWVDVAHNFGYHDQMHMIHDFEKLGGDAPAKFLMQLGNMRFPALSNS